MSGYRETFRGSVAAWECDQYGHMNVQFYMARLSDAAALTMTLGGMGEAALHERRLGIVAVHQDLDYLRELRAGDPIRMESGLKSVDGRKIVFHHRLFNAETGALCFKADVLGLCFDLATRRSIEFPADLKQSLAALIVSGEEPPEPQALPGWRDGFIATGAAPVLPTECDRMGHMNVQFYLGRAAEAEKQALLALGLGAARLRELGATPQPSRYRLLFKREMRVTACGLMESALRQASPDRITLHHVLRHGEDGGVAALAESEITLTSLADGAPLPFPEAVLAAARAHIGAADLPPLPGQPGLPRPPEYPVAGMMETGRGTLDRWECDEYERLATRFYMRRFSDAGGNLLAGSEIDPQQQRAHKIGSAVLDYTVDILQPLRLGDAFYVRTGVLEIREKTWRFCHMLCRSHDDALIARGEVLAVCFDLEKRKAMSIPAPLRAAIENRRIAVPAAAE